jgi:site-specific recombinase XerD
MKITVFQSSLAAFLSQFVQYKQALNRKYHADVEVLRLFDRYLHNRHIAGWQEIDSALIDDFLKSRPRVRPGSYNHLLGVLRRFFAFAIMQEWIQCSPVTANPRRNTGGRIPYCTIGISGSIERSAGNERLSDPSRTAIRRAAFCSRPGQVATDGSGLG